MVQESHRLLFSAELLIFAASHWTIWRDAQKTQEVIFLEHHGPGGYCIRPLPDFGGHRGPHSGFLPGKRNRFTAAGTAAVHQGFEAGTHSKVQCLPGGKYGILLSPLLR